MKQLATRLGVADRIRFAGFVDDEEKLAVLGAAKVFAMPSIAELQSISTMEAMASGLPIVAANAMALPHLVHDGQNGYLFEPGSAQDLADKLSLVFSRSPEQLDALKHESLKLIEAHDIKRTLNTFERLYRGESTTDPNGAALGNPAAAQPEVLDAAPSRD